MKNSKIEIRYSNGKFIVTRGSERYRERTQLDPLEVAYLLQEDRAVVYDEGGRSIDLRDLVSLFSEKKEWWLLFTVLYDLYKRGRIARRGFTDRDLMIEREGKKYQIYVAEENVFIPISLVLEWIESSMSKGLIPVIAVVDMYGDVTYYKASKHSFRRIEREEL
ncbi:MAG: hypothetical protein ABWJ42_05930 [Sulfolobales archaeon]